MTVQPGEKRDIPPGWLTLREALAILEARRQVAPAMDELRAALEAMGARKQC